MLNLILAVSFVGGGHIQHINSIEDVEAFFPLTEEALLSKQKGVLDEFKVSLDQFLDKPSLEALDDSFGASGYASEMFEFISMVHTDPAIRDLATQIHGDLNKTILSKTFEHPEIYNKLLETKPKNDKERYFRDETLKELQSMGLALDAEKRKALQAVNDKLIDLCAQFGRNIAEHKPTMVVSRDELTGMDEIYINGLEQNEEGNYILTTDYPVYRPLMESCSNGELRKAMYHLFSNRAYPQNADLLEKIAQKRHEKAQLLGYESFAHLQLESQMVGSPKRADEFLNTAHIFLGEKSQQEFTMLSQDLPKGVALNDQGQIQPWDENYSVKYYLKKHYDVDPEEIKAYFPLNSTLRGLMDVYETFLGIKLEEVSGPPLWHESVRLIRVLDAKTGEAHGFIALDLHPRKGKFTHACDCPLHPALQRGDERFPALSVLVCNFPSGEKALMRPSDVRTFFHEFGHALHDMLGRTNFVSTCGTCVKQDFVELPSQLLEEWLWDEQILQMCSSHFETGEPLPKELIKRRIDAKNAFVGMELSRQLLYANYSLKLFMQPDADLRGLWNTLAAQFQSYRAADATNKYASFGHLTNYGARYYGYLWSKIFALDVFAQIKSQGLLNPEAGNQYVSAIIGQGGSQDPNELLCNFLGREPTQDAFFESIGLK